MARSRTDARQDGLEVRYRTVRALADALTAPLDAIVQSMADASPAKSPRRPG